MNSSIEEQSGIRRLMQGFIDDRLATKLDKLAPDDPKYQSLQTQFDHENWIADAARRVSQLQVVTHSLKAIHPDAKGTSLFASPVSLPLTDLISSRLLDDDYAADVVGNAAALDVYKFLKLEYEGKSLLELALDNDPRFVAALNDDLGTAQDQAKAFASIVQSSDVKASSTRAKQIYWLIGDDPSKNDHYHLLAPLYPTSLVHKIYQTIQEDRFGDAPKAARQARRERKASETGYQDYPNLAVQKLGGTKPQNISQLNSERGGTNYLLASLPPQWESSPINAPLHTDSVFPRFGRQRETQWLSRSLFKFLKSNPPRNMDTRVKVDAFVDGLIEEMVMFSARFQMLEPGWSADPNCRLAEAEALWLDGMRGETDEHFKAKRDQMDWPEEVEERFARWVNYQLRDLPVGDVEHAHWGRTIRERLNVFQEVLYG